MLLISIPPEPNAIYYVRKHKTKCTSWHQKYVMTSDKYTWRQKDVIMSRVRHDVKKYVMTSKCTSWCRFALTSAVDFFRFFFRLCSRSHHVKRQIFFVTSNIVLFHLRVYKIPQKNVNPMCHLVDLDFLPIKVRFFWRIGWNHMCPGPDPCHLTMLRKGRFSNLDPKLNFSLILIVCIAPTISRYKNYLLIIQRTNVSLSPSLSPSI